MDDFEVAELKPPLARRIRDFFETLFTGRLVLQLRADLDEARSQRDYFKGRAERLELQLLQPRIAARQVDVNTAEPRVHSSATVGGRKTWQQIIADRRKQLAQLALDKATAKQNPNGKPAETSAPATPAQN